MGRPTAPSGPAVAQSSTEKRGLYHTPPQVQLLHPRQPHDQQRHVGKSLYTMYVRGQPRNWGIPHRLHGAGPNSTSRFISVSLLSLLYFPSTRVDVYKMSEASLRISFANRSIALYCMSQLLA